MSLAIRNNDFQRISVRFANFLCLRETKMENPGGINKVSHPLFKTNPSKAEEKEEGEVGKTEKERNGRSSPMFSDSVVNDR